MGFLIFAAALLSLLLCFCLYSYRVCFHVPKQRNEDIYRAPNGEQYKKWSQRMLEISLIMDEAECEWVCITADDGSKLHGRLYEFYPGAPLILAFHGYRSMALRDCAGAFALSQKLGFNILAVDQRSHGKSDGNAITFGIRERHDCLNWVKFALAKYGPDVPIILSGISMGAATVLMASELELPDHVVCILADCPYDSPAAIIRKVAVDRGYPGAISMPVIRLGARLFGRLDLMESSASEAVRHTKVPILLLHGEDDRFVPCQMSKNIYQNCSSYAELHTFPDAGHGLCYIMYPRRYEQICVEFLWQQPSLRPYLQKSEFAMNILAK